MPSIQDFIPLPYDFEYGTMAEMNEAEAKYWLDYYNSVKATWN